MGMNMIVYQIVNEFKRLDEVVAITLAGSCASGRKDNYSDIDIDIITERDIPVEKRESIAKKFSDLMEINNTFWGPSDEFVLRNSSIQVDIAYFDFKWLKEKLENILENHIASIGYTTCFWNNVINSLVVFDKMCASAMRANLGTLCNLCTAGLAVYRFFSSHILSLLLQIARKRLFQNVNFK